MASSDLERALYGEKIVVFPIGTLTNFDTDADNVVATMICPRNLILKGVGVSWTSATGTTPSLTAKVTTIAEVVLASSGAATTIATEGGIYAEDANAFVSKGQVLNITLRSANDDNDFVAAAVTVVFEHPKTDS